MVNGQPAFVLVNQDERRAVDRFARNVEAFSRCLNESGFARAEISHQRDDQLRLRGLTECATKLLGVRFAGEFEDQFPGSVCLHDLRKILIETTVAHTRLPNKSWSVAESRLPRRLTVLATRPADHRRRAVRSCASAPARCFSG